MTKYLLVSFKTCPWVQRAAIVLREKKTSISSSATSSHDNRPDWFLAISPHKKVPVLQHRRQGCRCSSRTQSTSISTRRSRRGCTRRIRSLRASQPRLDRLRADLRESCVEQEVGLCGRRGRPAESLDKIPQALRASLDRRTRKKRGAGRSSTARIFAGRCRLCAVPAALLFLDRIRPIGLIEKYPRLKAWAETLMKRPSTHSFPEAEFEALYRANVKRRKKWLSQFIADVAVAAE